ncbi:MAG: hypothetical protein WEB53_11950 [Akkermansiaceae bacterium]
MDLIHQILWRPRIGDPTMMGWFTVAAYGFGAVGALLAAARAGNSKSLDAKRSGQLLWLLVAMLMVLLGLNKQLDLQTLLTDIGRVISHQQGWYENRREFQKWFVLGVLAASGFSVSLLAWKFRSFWREHILLAAGLGFLLTFIVIRVITFHHIEAMLNTTVSGMKMNGFFELGGIALILTAAARDVLPPRLDLKH